jgi:hypothetical protein
MMAGEDAVYVTDGAGFSDEALTQVDLLGTGFAQPTEAHTPLVGSVLPSTSKSHSRSDELSDT